ncbi:MAG TPA: hypothetical protein VFO64_04785, partial [Gaiellaceae bacterium]|nr:hypothetical protein [Gaiellaceae bacterium]
MAVALALAAVALTLGSGAAPASTSTYRGEVLADGPAGYWRLGEASGTAAADETGTNEGTYQNGVTLGQAGVLLADT